MKSAYLYFLEYFRAFSTIEPYAKPIAAALSLVVIILGAWLAFIITRKIAVGIVHRAARRTKTDWDDILVKGKFFNGLSHLVPAFILYYSSNFSVPELHQPMSELSREAVELLSKDYYFSLAVFLMKCAKIYFVLILLITLGRFLKASNEIYQSTAYSHHRSIKGYIQLIMIVAYFVGGIIIISILLGKDPTVLFAGLGAMAAVLLLVFKDTILGLVASIQLSGNNMLKIGDWIEMPGHNAEGTVTDITLNTVKVQNGDKTISTIPTYSLVAESFKNWKGVEESDGRRIKRSVSIDINTIRFCDNPMLDKFEKINLIKDFIISKREEQNQGINSEGGLFPEGSLLTNIGVFRKYLEVYLKNHPDINPEMSFVVRQLQPDEKGLPIEVYVFCKDKDWANYESIQSGIFEHILAVIPEFNLRVYQLPSGYDVLKTGQPVN